MKLNHKQKNAVLGFLIGAVIVLLFGFVLVCLELKQSHANERSLSQRIDVLMEKASRP